MDTVPSSRHCVATLYGPDLLRLVACDDIKCSINSKIEYFLKILVYTKKDAG
jgi:hypothetical protein